jgi:hypothetical protein
VAKRGNGGWKERDRDKKKKYYVVQFLLFLSFFSFKKLPRGRKVGEGYIWFNLLIFVGWNHECSPPFLPESGILCYVFHFVFNRPTRALSIPASRFQRMKHTREWEEKIG